MKVCDGVRPLPPVSRASSPCDIFAAAEQCAAVHLEPLPPHGSKMAMASSWRAGQRSQPWAANRQTMFDRLDQQHRYREEERWTQDRHHASGMGKEGSDQSPRSSSTTSPERLLFVVEAQH